MPKTEVTIDKYEDRLEIKLPFDDAITRLEGGGERITDDDDNAWARWTFAADADPQASAEEAARLFKASFPVAPAETTTVTVNV